MLNCEIWNWQGTPPVKVPEAVPPSEHYIDKIHHSVVFCFIVQTKENIVINWALSLFKVWRDNRVRKTEERSKRYWSMNQERAKEVSFALFYELGAREAGDFMDEWRRRNRKEISLCQ